VRGENLLALGPVSDGVFGDYRYRHFGLREYLKRSVGGHPQLEGGWAETTEETRLRGIITHLMAGTISLEILPGAQLHALLSAWLRFGMLVPVGKSGHYELTANGSWFIARMMDEAEAAHSILPPTGRCSGR
jgi:hypothetical protein